MGPNNNSEDEVEEETLEEENNDNTTSILSVRRVDFVEPAKSSTFVPLGEQPMYKQFFIKVKDTLALIPVRCARNETSDPGFSLGGGGYPGSPPPLTEFFFWLSWKLNT